MSGAMGELSTVLFRSTTMNDLMNFAMMGNAAVLFDRNRTQIRQDVITEIMNDNSRPSPEDIMLVATSYNLFFTPYHILDIDKVSRFLGFCL